VLFRSASGAEAVAAAVAAARPGDTILTLGAGDVSKLADEVVRRLQLVAGGTR
jgi:UDP-N-acetylmuramate-alanine ligase